MKGKSTKKPQYETIASTEASDDGKARAGFESRGKPKKPDFELSADFSRSPTTTP